MRRTASQQRATTSAWGASPRSGTSEPRGRCGLSWRTTSPWGCACRRWCWQRAGGGRRPRGSTRRSLGARRWGARRGSYRGGWQAPRRRGAWSWPPGGQPALSSPSPRSRCWACATAWWRTRPPRQPLPCSPPLASRAASQGKRLWMASEVPAGHGWPGTWHCAPRTPLRAGAPGTSPVLSTQPRRKCARQHTRASHSCFQPPRPRRPSQR
mmetsp:Transcript_20033/g.68166  ORF Transcript_20033/g.68166 Transcript_20033/m.68166 type:complete len:211 (-) Transcript_20033:636-1268(-)